MTRLVLVPRPVPPPPPRGHKHGTRLRPVPRRSPASLLPLRSWLRLSERTMGPQVAGWASLKSVSFRNQSLNGRRGCQGRASSWAAARTRSGLCRGGIAVPGEPWAGLGGSGRAQSGAGNDRPALQPHPACRSARAGDPHLPPHCGAPGWPGARSARASRGRGPCAHLWL